MKWLERVDGQMFYRGKGGLEGPIFRCACPDGCSLGWGYVDGMCMACTRSYQDRVKSGEVTVPVGDYILPLPSDEPVSWARWEHLSSREMAAAKERTKRGLPPLGEPPIPLGLG